MFSCATGTPSITTRVSATLTTTESDAASGSASISADGRLIAFTSRASVFAREAELDTDVFVFDLRTRKLALVSADPGGSAAGARLR